MRTLSIDIETYSSVDLKTSGVYKYVESPDFEILMMAYAFDDEPVQLFDFKNELKGTAFVAIKLALTNPKMLKKAWNANFERVCLAKYFDTPILADQWECVMVKAAMLGLPFKLETTAQVLKLEQQKDKEGDALIRYFSKPCKPTKTNGMRTRNLPEHDPVKWEKYKAYCKQDVETERAIRNKISFFEIPEQEKKLWYLDQQINDRGISIDQVFINNAISIDKLHRERLTAEACEITGLQNPNSIKQLLKWLTDEMPLTTVEKLRKEDIPVLFENATGYENSDLIKRVLTLRTEMSKTSIKKYAAMLSCVCADGRVRGLVQIYGANRTGRFAGRRIQVHNLPKSDLGDTDLDMARELVKTNNIEGLQMLFGNVSDMLSQLIRTAFVASHDQCFGVSDFSAIEARILAWLAGEKWRLEVFKGDGKIYEASAAKMFKILIGQVTRAIRAKGKVAELALGYNGSVKALIKMGALKMGLLEKELKPLVYAWREANPNIVKYWKTVEVAAITAVSEPGKLVPITHGIVFQVRRGILFIKLPSGRELSYVKPVLVDGEYGKVLTFMGLDPETKQWGVQYTYGGKLVENITQAVARDCLAFALLNASEKFNVVMHVHDELVTEGKLRHTNLEELNKILATPIPWAKGLPLDAEGFIGTYYKKQN